MHSGKKLFKTKLVLTTIVKIDCMTAGHVRREIRIELWKYQSGRFIDSEVRKRPA
jgi:hypothetical protein